MTRAQQAPSGGGAGPRREGSVLGGALPTARHLQTGERVSVVIPKRTALGALCDEEGFARRRRATVVDPEDGTRYVMVRFSGGLGRHEVPQEWVR